MTTVIQFGYGASYSIEAKDVSTILAIFAKAQRVESRWNGEDSVWVRETDQAVRVTQDDGRIYTREEFDALKKAIEAEKARKEEAQRLAEAADQAAQ